MKVQNWTTEANEEEEEEQYLKIGHDRFISHTLQFISH
jgi:hypothetical protein